MPFSAMTGALGYQKDSVRLPIPLSTNSAADRTDGFVYKYGPDGQALWVARLTSAGDGNGLSASVQGTATDSTGAVYAVGGGFVNASFDRFIAHQTLFYNADGSFGGSISLPITGLYRGAFCAKYSASGVFQWAVFLTPPTTSNQTPIGGGVAVDSSDNVYFSGAIGGGAGVITAYNADGSAFGTTYPSLGTTRDAFLVKYSSSGVAQWLTRVAASGAEVGRGLVLDSTGVYMVGEFTSGTMTAYNADGTAFGTTFTRAGSDEAFIVKYTLTGTVSWFTRVSSTALDEGYAIALDSAGGLVVAGSTQGTATTAYNSDGTAFGTTITTTGLVDGFVVKYSIAGNVQWFAKMGGTAGDISWGITTDSENNVYVTGYHGAATFTAFNSDGTAFGTTLPNQGALSTFLVKYNSTGSVQWVAQMAGTNTNVTNAYAIVSDTSDNLHVVLRSLGGLVVYNSNGTTFATLSTATSPATCLVTYNSSGTALRTRVVNSGSSPLTICRDSANNIFVGGSFTAGNARSLGPSATVAFTIANRGSADAVLVKYRANGSPWWAARIASTQQDIAYGVATDSSGNIYVTGGIGGTLGGGAGRAFNADGTGFGSGDSINFSRAFLVKYNPFGVVQWDVSWTAPAGLGVAVDSAGNAYVCGRGVPQTNVLSAFNPNGSSTRITQSTSGTDPAMLVKYNTNGIPQWIARIATTNSHMFNAVAVDSSDNVIAVGYNSTDGVVFNADGTSFATIAGSAVVVKYNSSGSVQWVARVSNGTEMRAVTCDVSGNVYVGGHGGTSSVGPTVFNANGTTFRTLPVATGSGTDGFVVKYNSAGVVQWVARIASTEVDVPRSLATDLDGNLYVGGVSGTMNSIGTTPVVFFNADGTQTTKGATKNAAVGWLVKYSPSGRVQWNAWFDGTSGSADEINGVAVDRRGEVYVAGIVYGAGYFVDLGYAGSVTNIPASTGLSAAKFTPQGLLQWWQRVGLEARGGATDPDCNLIVVGAGTTFYAKA